MHYDELAKIIIYSQQNLFILYLFSLRNVVPEKLGVLIIFLPTVIFCSEDLRLLIVISRYRCTPLLMDTGMQISLILQIHIANRAAEVRCHRLYTV